MNSWRKEELNLDFDLAHTHGVPALLGTYVDFLITNVPQVL